MLVLPAPEILEGLTQQGFAVLLKVLPPEHLKGLQTDFRTRFEAKEFRGAGIGPAGASRLNNRIRRDHTLWFEPGQLSSAQAQLWDALESLRQTLNQGLYLGLWELEGHYAFYPPGGFYRRHLDRFQSDDKRAVSIVLYLNDGWKKGDGGELRLYLNEGAPPITVEPEGGTLVCFLSDRIEHEVLESHRERRSFAGWFRRRG